MAQKNLSIKLSLNDKQFQSSLRKATRSLKRFGSSMKRTGRNMTRSLTMPILALGGASVKLATDFQTSMTKISTLVGASAKDLKQYEAGIMSLSERVGVSAAQLADGLFFITSAGFQGKEGLDALEVSAKAAAMGMGEMSSIANALTSIMTAYEKENMTSAKAGDLLHETLKQGKFEAAEFMDKLGAVIPVAAAAGVSFEELGAASATMSKLSGDAAVTLTSMKSMIMALLKPTAQQEEILTKLKISTEQLGEMTSESLLGTLQFLHSRLKDNNEELLKMFGGSKSVVGMLSTIGLQSETYTEVLEGMHNSLGNVNNGFATLSGTAGFKFNQTLVKLQNAGIKIGNILLPVVLDLANAFMGLLDDFKNLSPEAQNLAVAATLLAGALGPLLMIMGSLVTIVTAISIKFVAIAIAVAALATGILFVVDNWEAFIERFKNIDWWRNTLLEMIALLIEFNPITLLNDAFNEFLKFIGVAQIPNPFQKGADFFRDMKVEIDDFENDFDDFGTFMERQGERVKGVLGDIANSLNLGGPSGGGEATSNVTTSTNTSQGILGPLDSSFFKNNPLQNILESVNFQDAETPFTGLIVKTEEELKSLAEQGKETEKVMQRLSSTMINSFRATADASDQSSKQMITSAKNAAREEIKTALAVSVANEMKSIFATVPFPFNLALAAGAGSIVGSLFAKVIPAFAEGGLVSGATLGLIGEGRGTSMNNPEVVAPLDKLKSMIGQGNGSIEVFGSISGQDILLSSTRARNNRTRTRGY
jgi:TP901 family phage tail tape measure protein